MPGLKIDFADGESFEFGVTSIPSRKSKFLYSATRNGIESLAYFRSEEKANKFQRTLERIIEKTNNKTG